MRMVYSYYVLDLVHRGHLRYMKNCKILAGDDGISVVGILTDKATMEKKPKPILSFDERIALADAIKYNDLVVAQATYSPIPNIKALKPTIVIESASHAPEDIAEVSKHAEVIMFPYFPIQSSSNIKNNIRRKPENG